MAGTFPTPGYGFAGLAGIPLEWRRFAIAAGEQAQRNAPAPLRLPKQPTTAAQRILFSGSLVSGTQAAAHAFEVLAGDGAPTITGGFAKWRVINRPRRVGLTVLDGYDPITMDIPVMFDAVTAYANKSPHEIESDIGVLEWMGGRGLLFNADHGIGHPGQGDSPLVQVFTADGHGNQVPLVPFAYQTSNLFWVVTNIAHDPAPDRNTTGYRIRQKTVITLTEYVGGPFATSPDSPAARAQAKSSLAGQFEIFRTTDSIDTIKLVANKIAHNPTHEAAAQILAANKSNKRIGTSVNKKLPRHTRIRIPRSVIKQLL